jgi:predicted enzyme related to lactoylglutathione lyase
MGLRGFSTINYWADDVPAAAAWYTEFLGVDPYFSRSGPDGKAAYVEYRIGDFQAELGLIDSRSRPTPVTGPGGAIIYWHVDDLESTVERLLSLGATELEPITPRGDGFVTASVVDPFGNVLGVMYNQHYLDVLAATKQA